MDWIWGGFFQEKSPVVFSSPSERSSLCGALPRVKHPVCPKEQQASVRDTVGVRMQPRGQP